MQRGEGQRETNKATGALVPFQSMERELEVHGLQLIRRKNAKEGDIDASGGEMANPALAALRAAGHNRGVETLAKVSGKLIDLICAVDLDRLAGGIEGHLAVWATIQMGMKLLARFSGYRVVDHVVEKG